MELSEIDTASVAVVTLAFREQDVTTALAGSGVLVPPVEGRMVKAITYLDQKWGWLGEAAHGAGVRLLRLSLGRYGEPEVLHRSDEEIVALARLDLALLLGIRGIPVDARVSRWGGSLPQYAVGHRRRVERIGLGLRETPTLALCGAAYEGVGVAACVGTAYEAAARVSRGLSLQGAPTTAGRARG
jgi:oxygen-dependent protoporphyrinogen oxidase